MTITTWLYLINIVENINIICGFFFAVLLIFIFVMLITAFFYIDYDIKNSTSIDYLIKLKSIFKLLPYMMLIIGINIIIPDKNTMYMMLGSSYLSRSDVPKKVAEIINYKLEDILTKLKSDDKK
jgi:hypothetical protein